MLIHWQSHQEYLFFLHETKLHLDSSRRKRLQFEFGSAREKLRLLDLDPVMGYLSAFYPHTGRPAKNQTQIIRSRVLMLMLGSTSLTAWIRKCKADSLLALLIGCTPDPQPPIGSYFDLMDRLWTQPESSQRNRRKDLFPKDKNSKPSKKPGKGKKLPNRHSGIPPIPTHTGAGTAMRRSFISDTPFTCSAPTMPISALTCLSKSAPLTPGGMTASARLFPFGNSQASILTSLSGISVWTLHMQGSMFPFFLWPLHLYQTRLGHPTLYSCTQRDCGI